MKLLCEFQVFGVEVRGPFLECGLAQFLERLAERARDFLDVLGPHVSTVPEFNQSNGPESHAGPFGHGALFQVLLESEEAKSVPDSLPFCIG